VVGKADLADPVLWLLSRFLNHLVSLVLVSDWSDLSRNLPDIMELSG
jgi:hypothetical protein